MKKLLFALAVSAALISCKKDVEEIITPVEKLSPDIPLTITGSTVEPKLLYQPSATYNYLGYGYDVTENFDSETSIRANVVDIPRFDASPMHTVSLSRGTKFSWKTLIAKDAVDLSEQFSNYYTETKGLKIFGNTVNEAFPASTTANVNFVYGYYSNYMIRKNFRFYYDKSVNNFITNQFKQDLNSLDAENLIKKYGTHVLIGVNIGAKFDVIYQAVSRGGDRQKISMEGQRYAMKNTFGLPTGNLDDIDLQNLNANSFAKVYYTSTGGDMKLLKEQTFSKKVFLNISDWLNSRTEERARFIGASEDGFRPIYYFIDDASKKAKVMAYFDQYVATNSVKLTN
ncbi:MAC/perforin domain-containing protein [Pedobacter sp. Leaf132]|uniref:MAC/perforin domain-containing protein n=1 Tax=Pedobacter sp. Leaf132 TaxID=2876557 RepID=UPI001E2D02F1|nr:MAC/perforin domain-containing protein [Pedobacter sp. Leaf132]